MDILLTHGYFLYDDPHESSVMKPYPTLGILYISSYLKSQGFEVEIFDATFSSKQSFREYILSRRPAIVGFYCNLITRGNVIEMLRFCKEQGCAVVVGGPEPANYAEEYLERGADVVVVGEGELTLAALIPHLARFGPQNMGHIQGIVYREDEADFVYTQPRPQIPELDEMPFPDRDAIDIPEYVNVWRKHHGSGSVSLITARGCPYKCKWCSHAVFGYTHRRRSVENVANELELILGAYQPDMVWYADDVFTINHRWLYAYERELKRRDLHAPFETISREDRLNEKVVRTLAELGCYRLWLGAESGSQRILDAMQRQIDAQRTREMAQLLGQYGIEVGMFIMLGYPGETLEDIEETLEHLKKSQPDVFLTTVAYPIKDTPYYEEVSDRIIALRDWDDGSDRDFTVAGRYSRRFYQYATRWLVGEVAYHQARNNNGNYLHAAKSFLNAKIGRLGMAVTQHKVERG